MRPTHTRQTSRNLAAAPLALLALFLLAPGAAATARAAGCVHDALRRGAEPAGAAYFVRLIESGAMPAPDSADAPRPEEPAPPKPCDGPSCSNRSGLPAPPAPSIAPAAPAWAWAEAADAAPGPESRPLVPADSAARPRHQGPSIFHPPRASA